MISEHELERVLRGGAVEIDAATYNDYLAIGDASAYAYEVQFTDGTKRVCAFVRTVGDDASNPYLGFWTENGRFYCQHLVDRLEPTADEMDNYLPPLPART